KNTYIDKDGKEVELKIPPIRPFTEEEQHNIFIFLYEFYKLDAVGFYAERDSAGRPVKWCSDEGIQRVCDAFEKCPEDYQEVLAEVLQGEDGYDTMYIYRELSVFNGTGDKTCAYVNILFKSMIKAEEAGIRNLSL
ncbi:MAG: hypothetical protein OXB93_04865, partial [Cytophagales bacterium]|nr:hypothetical protein [Cytophagales bacterium]